jgi:hypothetical protein
VRIRPRGEWFEIFKQEDIMRRNLRAVWIVLFSMAFFAFVAFACVTINIYFPAEKVESVAGEIVRDVRGQKETDQEKPPKSDKNSSWMRTLLAFAPETAWAEEVTTVSNPAIRTLKDKLRSNFEQMKPYTRREWSSKAPMAVSLGTSTALASRKKGISKPCGCENQYEGNSMRKLQGIKNRPGPD